MAEQRVRRVGAGEEGTKGIRESVWGQAAGGYSADDGKVRLKNVVRISTCVGR